MRFVLGNRLMNAVGGTEVHLVTLGVELLRLGHEVVIYSPELGPYADYARERGLEVVDQIRQLPDECEVVLAQDGIVVYDLAERYPSALMVFRVCGDSWDFQSPPQVAGVVDLVLVLGDRYARLAEGCAVRTPILRLRIPVDIDRLQPGGSLRATPRRAVLLGNYGERDQVVREAWGQRGLEVDAVGGAHQRFDVATALADADIVVAKSRAVLDAMACGRAVYVYDLFGGDGWVTPETYPAMEADHFAGQATDRVIGAAELHADLDDYSASMGKVNRDLVVQHHRAREHALAFLEAVSTTTRAARPQTALHELARLTALQWSWERLFLGAQSMHGHLHDRVHLAEQAAAAAAAQRAEATIAVGNAERQRDEALARADEASAALVRAEEASAALRDELDAIRRSRAWLVARWYWRLRERLLGQ